MTLDTILSSINDLTLALNNHAEAIRTQSPVQIPPVAVVEDEITLGQIQQALIAISNVRGAAEAKKIVKQFGVEKAKEIKVEDYQQALAACELTDAEKAELEGK
ncbi:MAG: hypothetical protein ACR2IJ_11810 [Fluviibacter sp.]